MRNHLEVDILLYLRLYRVFFFFVYFLVLSWYFSMCAAEGMCPLRRSLGRGVALLQPTGLEPLLHYEIESVKIYTIKTFQIVDKIPIHKFTKLVEFFIIIRITTFMLSYFQH